MNPAKTMDMNSLSRIFLKGMAITVPLAGTVAIVIWLGSGMEELAQALFNPILPETARLPGVGIILGIVSIFLIGLLAHVWIFEKVIQGVSALMSRAPLVKVVYSSLKDLSDFVWPKQSTKKRLGQPALIYLEKLGLTTVGFRIVDNLAEHELGQAMDQASDKVAVYLPMSYQIGGYMAIVEKSCVTPLEMSVEAAIRLTLTAGVTGESK